MCKLLTHSAALQALQAVKKVEYKHKDYQSWKQLELSHFTLAEFLCPDYQYRLAQEILTVGDVSFPKAVTQQPQDRQTYYFPHIAFKSLVDYRSWGNSTSDFQLLKANMVHLNKENAIAHAKALIKLSRGICE